MAETVDNTQRVESRAEMDPLDFLMHRSESDPRRRTGFVGVEVLDGSPDWERLVETFERASRTVPRLRQKVVVPSLPVVAARWVVDPDFDLSFHLRRVRVAEPATIRQVLDMAELIAQSPLDVSRALWEVTLVEGLQDGQAALITKLSHAVADGVAGVEMRRQIYDLERHPPHRAMPPRPVPQDLSPNEMTRSGVGAIPTSAVTATRRIAGGTFAMAVRGVRRPTATASSVVNYVRSAQRLLAGPPAPPSPLLRRRSVGRRIEPLEFPLDQLRRAAKVAGGSVNDAYLAALCGVLRLYHEKLGMPVEAISMAVPVSLRTGDDPLSGNRWAGVLLRAPVGEADPIARIRIIRGLVAAGRSEPAIDVLRSVAPVLSRIPVNALAGITESLPAPDIQASNVPGSPEQPYIAGARVETMVPLGPVPGVALMVVLMSQAGTCFVGARYDTAAISERDLFARCLEEGFAEVLAMANDSATSGKPRSPRRSASRTGASR